MAILNTGIKKRVFSNRDTKGDYTVIVLAGKVVGEDLGECMKVRCTNKTSLEEVTGIGYDRLVYLFAKKKLSYVVENDCLIIKTSVVMKGRQPGGVRNNGMVRNKNR